jgi:hypothetical protein
MTNYPQADDPLVQQVWQAIQAHKGYNKRLDRSRLTFKVYGRITDSLDRKIRDALAELPVVWDDGYFVPTSYDEASGYIASMRSRQAAIGQRLRVLDQYLRTQLEPVRVEQMSWMEG